MNRAFGIFAVLTTLASSVYADGWTSQESVNYINVTGQNADGSRVYVIVSPAITTSCTAANASTQLRLDASNQRGKYQLSLVSMALATDKRITTNVESCDDWGFPVIYDLQLWK